MRTAGIVLAAGAGARFGRPKATVVDPDGTSWLRRTVEALRDAGCDSVYAVLGSGAQEAAGHLDAMPGVAVVLAEDWAEGVSASLRAGLDAVAADPYPSSAVVTLVDLPDVSGAVIARVLAAAGDDPALLARAVFAGRPGHPVVLGRSHWAAVRDSLEGDRGAGPYLSRHHVVAVECGDLAGGEDVDQAR